MVQPKPEELASYIDHTLLNATTTGEQIRKLCAEAADFGFCAVSVNPRWVEPAADELDETNVKVGSVLSLPLGADSTKIKAAAAEDAIFNGADEIDMVADLGAVIEQDERYLTRELKTVLKLCRSMRPPVLLKVIIEAAALKHEQKIFACRTANDCGVDFVKTSTGMHPAGGATIEDVELIRQYAPNCRIKAAGGIRTYQQIAQLIEAGAQRIGTSAGVKIINQLRQEQAQ